ncbi:tripartite tricarboxylate transporter substrate binding protein [Variovorax sp. YR216]|uniref:Bug family tripartite tricarboxylate transporter substrate binding protein n=1 Tax=Variovorax sp. YR216 TaxID=1882828 RepID=UPI00089B4094|nr:tripartite tricarboxylate transporter substrate binding protein [Variovorax sp. YR216]SEB20012.1 Tripartite-type tricarboxylate transporter, receptor component TctC [Variovorax sp. YR216]
MLKRNFIQGMAALLATTCAAWPAAAQTFPERPVRVVVPFAAGNTLDGALRQVAVDFQRSTGQPLIIDNKAGGGGIIAATTVAHAAPDGYTLLLSNTSMLAINPHTFAKLPYDADKSFKPVTGFLGASLVLAVNAANVPARTLSEFIAWARSNPPGGASYASFTAGNSSHFAGVILNKRAGLEMVHVPFNGTPPAVQNLVGGQVQAAFLPLLAVKPQVDSGKVRVLAVSTPKRSPLMPDVPTFREAGFADLTIYIWSGLSAPAGTPDVVIARLNTEFRKLLGNPELQQKWRELDFEALPMSPTEYRDFVQADSKRWAEAVQLSGFKASE